ncbi:hypothetical protein [uncultured Aquimarina sp.]|uniref:hypothetical protein n=1 Tax=uncultured Aquimarina sp. TaxID=575652 RepID=UPI00263A1398|nr:hypothetical protein [uncultured Aquimarina sp.]
MKTYYNDTPRKVAFENKSIGKQDAKDYFLALSDHQASYIGFLDVYDDVLIFKWLSENKWIIDHPVVPDTLHRQRYATQEECLIFIEKVYQEYDISSFQGFEDVPIGEFTLDEMIAFKEEDEYLLREEEPPAKKVIAPKSTSTVSKPKKASKPSIILGDITIPKEKPRTKYISRVTDKKKQKTSPLKQFKESTKELKKEKQQPSVAKVTVQPVTKKTTKLKSTKDKTHHTSLLHLEKTIKPKKENSPSLVIGEQLGVNSKSKTTPTPSKVKTNPNTVKKNKPTNNDNSLFSI